MLQHNCITTNVYESIKESSGNNEKGYKRQHKKYKWKILN